VTGTSWQPPSDVFRTLRKPINSDVLVKVVQRAVAHDQVPAGIRITTRRTINVLD
jgi:FixJ family two-component response regulator